MGRYCPPQGRRKLSRPQSPHVASSREQHHEGHPFGHALFFTFGFAALAPAIAGSLGGTLELADEGNFFVGGQVVRLEYPGVPLVGGSGPGSITVNQMYVLYRIPKSVNAPPIIMVHGSGHTGVTYETTPDGREGWATYFSRKGFPVYVVDHAGRGRSGFDPTVINRARIESDPHSILEIALPTRERAWQSYHLGPAYPNFYPGSQFPGEAVDHYFSQLVPSAETTLPGSDSTGKSPSRVARQSRPCDCDGTFAIRRIWPRLGAAAT